jgi:hypothetical protein
MDHIVYLDAKSKELDNLKNGDKTMIIRGAMGRKLPYGRVNKSNLLYFIENNGDGQVKAKAVVDEVFNSEKLTKEESEEVVKKYQNKLLLGTNLMKRFAGKRFIVLISIKEFQEIPAFKIDKSDYGNMDDWLAVEKIENVRLDN